MAICPPIIPNSATGLFNTTSQQFFTAAFDSPVNRYDPRQIRALNVLLNALLQTLPPEIINTYPDLKARFDQGAISDEEFSNILFDQGISPDTVQDIFESDLPNPISVDEVADYIDDVEDAINAQLPTSPTQLAAYRDSVQDAINDQLANQGPFINTGSDIVNDAVTGGDDIPLDRFIPDIAQVDIEQWQPSPELEQYLQQADNYYKQNLAAATTENVCGGFVNPFAKLSSLIAGALAFGDLLKGLGDKVKGLINSIKNFSVAALLSSLVSKLSGLMQGLLDLPKKLQAQLLSKVKSLQETALKFIDEVKAGAKNLFKYVNKKVQEIKDYLSDLNIEAITNKVKSVFDLNQNQFEDLLPAVLNLLALKACGLSNGISLILSKPVDKLKSFIDRMLLNYQITQNESLDHTNRAITAGAIRIPSATRVEEQERAIREFNNRASEAPPPSAPTPDTGAAPSPAAPTPDTGAAPAAGAATVISPSNYITLPISAEERRWLDTITKDYNTEFQFSDSVKSMGSIATNVYQNGCPPGSKGRRPADHATHYDPKQNEPNSGWKMIIDKHPQIFVALRRASIKLDAGPLTINSAYRSPYYNRIVLRECQQNKGAAWTSKHMSAMAIDISTRGLTNEQTALLIKYCSQEGFSRISVYDTFIHCDIADTGNYRGNWTKNYRGSPEIKTAMELHLSNGHRNGNDEAIPLEDETQPAAPEVDRDEVVPLTRERALTRLGSQRLKVGRKYEIEGKIYTAIDDRGVIRLMDDRTVLF